MLEIESKVRVEGHAETRRRLEALKAVFIGRYLETNHILDRADGSLRNADCGLRVRTMTTLQGVPAPPTLTYKGPRRGGSLKTREEIELEIGSPDELLAVLKAVGFQTVVHYRKRRERWSYADCHIELDEVPMLGTFVEIEGESEAAVCQVQDRIGLGALAQVQQSYVHLLTARCRELGRSTVGIDFDTLKPGGDSEYVS